MPNLGMGLMNLFCAAMLVYWLKDWSWQPIHLRVLLAIGIGINMLAAAMNILSI